VDKGGQSPILIAMFLKRSALHALVWSKPMTHIARDLGISDVGLAKTCRRHGVPVPPRGHWAKLAAGKSSPQLPLPEQSKDYDVQLTTIEPVRRKREKQERQVFAEVVATKVQALAATQTPDTKRAPRAHPLIRCTRAFVAKIPDMVRKHEQAIRRGGWTGNTPYPPMLDRGRRFLTAPDGLHMVVSDASLEWAINLHERFIRGLESAGVRCSGAKHPDNKDLRLACDLNGELLYVGFSEGYRRRETTEEERASEKASGGYPSDMVWEASGRFTWSASGTERTSPQKWSGKQEDVERKLPEIVAGCLTLLEAQPGVRARRLAHEEQMRQEAAERARARRREEALTKQVESAFAASRAHGDEIALREYLDFLEISLSDYRAPFREKLAVWISVVRKELKRFPPHVRVLADSIQGNRWNDEAPDWWPSDTVWPKSNSNDS
jgi:hypothetical protein